MINQAVAQLLGDHTLQSLKFGIDELNHFARFYVDQMIVMRFWRGFIACTPIAKIMPVKDAGFLEQAHSPIDRGNRDTRVDGRGPLVNKFDIGMVFAFRKNTRDHAALLGDAQALVSAKLFQIDLLRQSVLRPVE